MLKSKIILFASCLGLFLMGCSDDQEATPQPEAPYVNVNQHAYNDIDASGAELTLSITSNQAWVAESDAAWCKILSGENGSGSGEVVVEITENLGQDSRTAAILLQSVDGNIETSVTFTQLAQPFVEGGHYKIPVVFQCLYTNKNDENQYVRPGHLQTVIDEVNRLYRESGVDLNMEFVMATEDPKGNPMEEPGVNRVPWTTSTINCETFMSSREQRYLDLIWDPDRYINIMLYRFSNSSILGIAQFPFVVYPDYLIGAEVWMGDVPVQENLNRPQCVSINNSYIYDMGGSLTPENPGVDDGYVVVTIAHELGHYLGLRHAFSESYMGCADTDFCEDTPTYNRDSYLQYLNAYGMNYKAHLDELILREDCLSGMEYVSTNIMDYSISYANRFTEDQAERIRYILEHGAFVPGPKNRATKAKQTRSTGMLDLPMQIMK